MVSISLASVCENIYENWPAPTNAIVGLSGQGTPAPYQQYTRRKLPVQVTLCRVHDY
jgi:hypothetical protein